MTPKEKSREEFKKYIGKSFNTVICPDIFTIVGLNSNGYVVLSDQNGRHFEYLSVEICLETIKNGSSWIFINEETIDLKQYFNKPFKEKLITGECTNKISFIFKINEENKVFIKNNIDDSVRIEPLWYCLMCIKDDSWIFVDNKELKNPFFLDEHLYNQDLEKRNQAESKGKNEKKVVVLSSKEFDFDVEVQSTLQKIQELLLVKGKEYRRNNNPYHNFETAAQMKGITPEKALDGFLLKHIVSYNDMLNDIDSGILPKIEVVEEKFNDILVYFLIQKVQIINRIKNAQ